MTKEDLEYQQKFKQIQTAAWKKRIIPLVVAIVVLIVLSLIVLTNSNWWAIHPWQVPGRGGMGLEADRISAIIVVVGINLLLFPAGLALFFPGKPAIEKKIGPPPPGFWERAMW